MGVTSGPARTTAALLLFGCATTACLLAHGGHGGVQPVVRTLSIGDQAWRVSVGFLPQDPVGGEDVRLEVKAEALRPGRTIAERVATRQEVRASVDDATIALRAADASGVLGGHYPATVAGPHNIVIEVRTAAGTGRSEYPLQVRTGPVARVRPLVAGALALLAAAFVFEGWQRRRHAGGESATRWLGAAALVSLVIVALGTLAIVPLLARQFLPQRAEAAIDWETDTPQEGTGEKTSDRRPAASAGHTLTS